MIVSAEIRPSGTSPQTRDAALLGLAPARGSWSWHS